MLPTKETIFNLINQSCKYMSKTIKNRPNTFAVLSSYDQMEKSNLGFTPFDFSNKKIWSRQYTTANDINLKYPYCLLINTSINSNVNEGGSILYDLGYDLQIIDTYIENKEIQTKLQQRTQEEIVFDNILIIEQIILYLQNVGPYKVEITTGVFETNYYNKSYLDYCVANNLIVGYSTNFLNRAEMDGDWRHLLNMFKSVEILAEQLEYLNDTISTSIVFKIPTISCPTANFDYSQNNTTFVDSKLVNFGGNQKH